MTDIRVTPRRWLWTPRTKPVRFIEVHATRGDTTPAKQRDAALNWVQSARNVGNRKADGTPDYANPLWGSSFSYVIGTDGSMGTVLDDSQAPTYSAGYGGPGSTWSIDEYGISYELAQSAAKEPFTDACIRRAAKEVAAKCQHHNIPVIFLTIPKQSGPVPTGGLVRHDRCQNGYVLGKSDPGDQFDEAMFVALVKGEMGDMGPINLLKPIVGMAVTPKGDGYWLVSADGGIFSFGKAGFHGSAGNIALKSPIVGMATTPKGDGYWLVAADGGIFSYDAPFHGSIPALNSVLALATARKTARK